MHEGEDTPDCRVSRANTRINLALESAEADEALADMVEEMAAQIEDHLVNTALD